MPTKVKKISDDELTDSQLKKLVEEWVLLKEEISDIKAETGIDKKEEDARKLSTTIAAELLKRKLDLYTFAGRNIKPVERKEEFWALNSLDVPEGVDGSSLLSILKKRVKDPAKRRKVLNTITRRIIDPSGLDMAVKTGEIKIDWILPAHISFVKSRYCLLTYDDDEEEDEDT